MEQAQIIASHQRDMQTVQREQDRTFTEAAGAQQQAITDQEWESVRSVWRRSDAISMCRKIEAICPLFGCHVALTGGLLYKDGDRKDCDILFYRIRQVKEINMDGLWRALEAIRFYKTTGFDWCYKALYRNKPVDCFFPEGGNSGESTSPQEPSANMDRTTTQGL